MAATEDRLGRSGLRLGVMRIAGTVAIVSLLALGVYPSTASAEPLLMTFTEARANVGVQLSDASLFEAPDTAPLEAQIDPASGSITAGDLQVPDFSTHITDPLNADVTVDFEIGVITGSFTQPTGALTLEGVAGGTLTSEGKECTVSTTPPVLALSSATTGSVGGSPRSGAPFIHGLTGAGAVAGEWTDMSAAPKIPGEGVAVCETVDERIEGVGGIWLELEGDVVPPPPPQLVSMDPASGLSGTPRILGNAEAGSTVSIYSGPDCAGMPIATGSAAELSSPGIPVEVAGGATATFSATATDAAANPSACSTAISYTRIHGDPPRPPPRACIVPRLAGQTLARSKRALAAAGCRLGTVRKPKRLKGKGWRPLFVKSSNPAAGASPTSGKVDLRLGPKTKRAHRQRDRSSPGLPT